MSTRKPMTAEETRRWADQWFEERAAKVLGVTVQQLREAAAEGTIVAKPGSVVAMYLKVRGGK